MSHSMRHSFILAATSVSISRVMLSFHALAEHLRNDPSRIGMVNSIPLNRVNWKRGPHVGEFLVVSEDNSPIIESRRNV